MHPPRRGSSVAPGSFPGGMLSPFISTQSWERNQGSSLNRSTPFSNESNLHVSLSPPPSPTSFSTAFKNLSTGSLFQPIKSIVWSLISNWKPGQRGIQFSVNSCIHHWGPWWSLRDFFFFWFDFSLCFVFSLSAQKHLLFPKTKTRYFCVCPLLLFILCLFLWRLVS